VLSFSELAKLLDLQEDEIEEWAITAITNDIIDGRIDQLNQNIIIKTHKLRQLNNTEWLKVQAKVAAWKHKFQSIHHVLEKQPADQ